MKKYLIFSVLFSLITFTSVGQVSEEWQKPVTQQDYLKLSRNQKTAGIVCLGITAVMVAIAVPGKVDFSTLGTLAGVGLASALTSIPFFIASGRNKRKARFMVTSQKIAFSLPNEDRYITNITLKLPLGR